MKMDYFEVTGRAKKIYAGMMEPLCRCYGLTKNEMDVLLFLCNNPEFDRAADVVTHRGMTKSHVSLSVGELEKRGLLVRCDNAGDRRTVRLKLTDAAREITEEGQKIQRAYFSQLFAGLSKEDMVLWQGIMERICRNINNFT